jgi:hypothetical protein
VESEGRPASADPRIPGPTAAGTDPVGPVVDRIVERLEERVDAMVRAMVDTVRHELPAYRALDSDAGATEALEDATRRVVQMVLRVWRSRGHVGAGDRAILDSIAGRRADQGVPLESLVGSVRIARSIGWTYAVEAVRSVDPGAEGVRAVGDMAALLFEAVDEVCDTLAAGYRRVQDTRGRVRERTRSQVFTDLLGGAFDDEEEIIVRARTFGFDLRRPHGLVLVTPVRADQDRAQVRAAVAALLPSLGNTAEVAMTADITPHVALVVSTSTVTWDEVVEEARRMARTQRVTAVLAAPVLGARSIHVAYQRARDLLPLAVTVYRRPHVVEADELVVYQILRGSRAEDREAFLDRTVGPVLRLPETQRAPLLETLDALHEGNGHTETAAVMLGVHTNTVRYRIGRIHQLTGLRYDRPPDRFKLEVATILLRMSGVLEPRRGGRRTT